MIRFCIILLSYSYYISALAYQVQFTHLSLKDGLSQATVFCMLQDSRGFMWFGTEDGLNQYDGYKFTVYRHNPKDINSLSNNWINALYEDKQGILWIGTEGGGLNRLDYETQTFKRYLHQPDNPHSLSHDTVLSIYEDSQAIMWIGTDEGGLNQFDRQSGQFIRYQHDPKNPHSLSHNKVWRIYEDSQATLWVGTYQGLNRFDRQTQQFRHYVHEPNNPYSLSHNTVLSLYEDRQGVLWIGTEGGGLNRFDRQQGRFKHYQHDPQDETSLSQNVVWAIYQDRGGELWIGTHGGLNRFNRQQQTFTRYLPDATNPYSLSHNAVWSIYEDNTEVLWISTLGGLNRFDRKGKKFKHYHRDPQQPQNSLSNNNVRAIYQDSRGILWIGTYGGGLNRFNRQTGQVIHYLNDPDDPTSLSHNNVRVIFEDSQKLLWVGTYGGGLNRFDVNTGQFYHYYQQSDNPKTLSDNNIKTIYEDTQGNLWIGTFAGGLNRFHPAEERFSRYLHDPDDPYSISSNDVQVIYEDSHGSLWIGTHDGLNRFDRSRELFFRYFHEPQSRKTLSNNSILSIYETEAGILWLGSYSGLNRLDTLTETFSYYTEADGLANEVIYGILEDDQGFLWLSTNKGLSKFNPKTETFRNYDMSDGLQSDEFNLGAYFKNINGELFFGGINGFNVFNPGQVKDNPYIPPVFITDFQIFNQSVAVGPQSILKRHINVTQDITLSYQHSVFSFEFAALDYTHPERNQYAYQLVGFDKTWNDVDSQRRFVTYTNLDPGHYHFKVKGSNNDGVWNEQGTKVHLLITPPWWETWWAYSLYVIAVLAIIWEYLRRQRQKLVESERINLFLEEKVIERTQELNEKNTALIQLNQEKNEFLGIAAHDLKNPLSAIKGLSEEIQEYVNEMPQEELVELAKMIQTSAEKMFQLITNLLDVNAIEAGKMNLNLRTLDMLPIVHTLVDNYRSRAQVKNIQIQLHYSAPAYWVIADDNTLQQILDNLISNAIKYSWPNKQVTVHLQQEQAQIHCAVADQGPGLSVDDQKKLFGKFNRLTPRPTAGEHSTGLGLFIVKKLIEAMHGQVRCQSELGQGSTFIVTLNHSPSETEAPTP